MNVIEDHRPATKYGPIAGSPSGFVNLRTPHPVSGIVSSGAKCTKNQRFEIAQLHCARELPSFDLLAKFGWTANPVKAGLWPPPPAADGLDRVCRPAVVCHHEIDGKVWPRGNFKPLVFGYFQAAVDKPTMIDETKERCMSQAIAICEGYAWWMLLILITSSATS